MPTPTPRTPSRPLFVALLAGLVGVCLGTPLSLWLLLRGEQAQVEPPSTDESARVLPTRVPGTWSAPGCAMPIVVRSIHSLELAAASLQPTLPAGHELPDDVELHILLSPEYDAS